MYKNLDILLESANLTKKDMHDQIVGLLNNVSERINNKVKLIRIEIYKDGDIALQLQNSKGDEADKGGFLPKVFFQYTVKKDFDKIKEIVDEALEDSDIPKTGIKVSVVASGDESTMQFLREASGDDEDDPDEDDEKTDNDKDDDDKDSDETEEEPEEEKSSNEEEEESSDGESIGSDELEESDEEKSSDESVEDNLEDDSEESESGDEDSDEPSEEEQEIEKIDILKIDIEGLSSLNVEINKELLLDKIIKLKGDLKNIVKIAGGTRVYITQDNVTQQFDTIIRDITKLIENISIYIQYDKVKHNSYKYSLETYIRCVKDGMGLIQKLNRIIKSVDKVKK